MATAHSRAAVEAGQVSGDALISIRGKMDQDDLRVDATLFGGRILKLAFDDIPFPTWTDKHNTVWFGPTRADLEQAFKFVQAVQNTLGRKAVTIACHCKQGKSRSAAIALAVWAANLPVGDEAQAVAGLLAIDREQQVCCNPGIVMMADEMLGRDGAIETAIAAACPRFVTWRAWWHGQTAGQMA